MNTSRPTITVVYSSIDHFSETKVCGTLEEARNFAQDWIGNRPEIGSSYAISGDGVGKIECYGCKITDLFPDVIDV